VALTTAMRREQLDRIGDEPGALPPAMQQLGRGNGEELMRA